MAHSLFPDSLIGVGGGPGSDFGRQRGGGGGSGGGVGGSLRLAFVCTGVFGQCRFGQVRLAALPAQVSGSSATGGWLWNVFSCKMDSVRCTNRLSQNEHLCGFSPVWIRS